MLLSASNAQDSDAGWLACSGGLAVLCHHAVYYYGHPSWLSRHGAMVVDLFFAISGLLITTQLLAADSLKSFYIRRAFRILPPAVLYLAVVFVLGLIGRGELFACLAIHRNYVGGSNYSVHFWSLSLEEQFYLVWPFVLYRSGKRAPTAAFIGIAAVCVWRALAAPHLTGWFVRTEERCDGLLWGCVTAFWLREPSFKPGKAVCALCLAGAVAAWQVPMLMSLMPALLAIGVLGSSAESILAAVPPAGIDAAGLDRPALVWNLFVADVLSSGAAESSAPREVGLLLPATCSALPLYGVAPPAGGPKDRRGLRTGNGPGGLSHYGSFHTG